MEIKVRLFATLREGRGKEFFTELHPEGTPADIIKILDIAQKDVAILLVNGRDAESNRQLSPGDTVSIFPPVGGG